MHPAPPESPAARQPPPRAVTSSTAPAAPNISSTLLLPRTDMQINIEARALAYFTFYQNISPGLLNDAIDNRKPQSRPLSLFSCEKRFENVRPNTRLDSPPRVGHAQHDVFAFAQSGHGRFGGGQFPPGGAD